MNYSQKDLYNIISQFVIYGDFLVGVPFGSGHVNDTFQLTFDQGGIRLHYILQRINENVFKEPEKVMDNVDRVTSHILKKIKVAKEETVKRTIRLLRTPDNKVFVRDQKYGFYWRAYIFVEHARAYEVLETPEQAFCIANAFGEFQQQLSDLPGERLHETIPNFHNTPYRIQQLVDAANNDKMGRLSEVQYEVDFVLSRSEEANKLIQLNAEGSIPERITHNDTKSNNILIDDLSGRGVCVIDLDTVMPGLALYDFGDMVRSGTNPAEEDEVNLNKVEMRFDMYEAFYRGYMKSASSMLTEAEKEMLPFAGKLITLEIGTRFLTDYLEGDVYFKIKRPRHNLDRCRNQFKMVKSIERRMNEMKNLLKD